MGKPSTISYGVIYAGSSSGHLFSVLNDNGGFVAAVEQLSRVPARFTRLNGAFVSFRPSHIPDTEVL